ncbi:MAG TPA: sigma 54-interacting transcriptional regulator [Planctomycetaceae bacterium]|nr:sigma 54-interacting transcriptional regulator [Planctomycetaceae bacterium]
MIHQIAALHSDGELPQVGDSLLSLDDRPLQTALDAAQAVLQLGRTPSDETGRRWVRVRYFSAKSQRVEQTRLLLQPVPLREIGLTVVWFLLQLCIFAVGAIAFWRRPYDRPARLFFAMCVVTLGAFVGGFHWWVLAGSLWLSLPLVVCAVLVPVVTLHFFLVYPRPKTVLVRWPVATRCVLYALPLLAMTCLVIAELAVWWRWSGGTEADGVAWTLGWLRWLRDGINVYLLIAAGYYAATLAALIHSVSTTRNVLERQQVTSILWAGLVAAGCFGYTLMLAYWDRVTFALGGARLPMFLASLVFMLAYAVSIVRYKLMLSDEWVGRGFRTELSRLISALACAAAVIGIGVLTGRNTSHLTGWQVGLASVVLLVIVSALFFGRDVWQRWIERRLFREKYRLEKALQRINRSVGQLADPQFLSERTLSACRDVLQAEWAGLYLRDRSAGDVFRLSAVEGTATSLPLEWSVPKAFLDALGAEAAIGSLLPESGVDATALREGLVTLSAELVQLLEIDGEPAGFVALGPKVSGGLYSPEDGTFLTALTQVTGVALHCVRVHQDLTHLNEQLRLKVDRIAQQKQQILSLQQELAASRTPPATTTESEFRRNAIKGSSAALKRVLETARKAAATEATVLLRGESGTGKELFAKAIHENSPRRNGPLITVHCAALAAGLLESELFGHVRGSFTGATADKPGRFELAQGGTLFLDEVGEISPETQVKLLRALQQKEIEPVGGQKTVSIDVRLVAATHRDLEAMIVQGRFREDLYYRLNVISIALPSLRDRQDDLYELAVEFLKRASARCDKQVVDFEDTAWELLLKHPWPGNIRELENVIERSVVMAEGNVITLGDLPPTLLGTPELATPSRRGASSRRSATQSVATITSVTDWRRLDADEERRLLIDALHQADGNKAQAAKLLGLPRSTFFSKLKKYSLAD